MKTTAYFVRVAETLFAPSARLGVEEIRRSFEELNAEQRYDLVLNLMPTLSFIVNERRQVIFANETALSSLGVEASEVLGARPGEVLDCIHAFESPGGCGTTEACRVCGAVGAVIEALEGGKKIARECRVSTCSDGEPGSLDFLVTAAPVASARGKFVVVTLRDISDSKRRQVLERLFFHDLMNGLSSLQACVILINKEFGGLVSEHDYFDRLTSATNRLIDEVTQQRELMTMESGDLEAELRELDPAPLARDAIQRVELTDFAHGKRVAFLPEGGPVSIVSDPVLLGRVLVNMLRNALEASHTGEEIRLSIADAGARIEISVRNSAFIPRELQLQVFQRSFSTKGRGRGIGTYSMKVLTEKYLRGEIGFSSDEREGTCFRILLPKT